MLTRDLKFFFQRHFSSLSLVTLTEELSLRLSFLDSSSSSQDAAAADTDDGTVVEDNIINDDSRQTTSSEDSLSQQSVDSDKSSVSSDRSASSSDSGFDDEPLNVDLVNQADELTTQDVLLSTAPADVRNSSPTAISFRTTLLPQTTHVDTTKSPTTNQPSTTQTIDNTNSLLSTTSPCCSTTQPTTTSTTNVPLTTPTTQSTTIIPSTTSHIDQTTATSSKGINLGTMTTTQTGGTTDANNVEQIMGYMNKIEHTKEGAKHIIKLFRQMLEAILKFFGRYMPKSVSAKRREYSSLGDHHIRNVTVSTTERATTISGAETENGYEHATADQRKPVLTLSLQRRLHSRRGFSEIREILKKHAYDLRVQRNRPTIRSQNNNKLKSNVRSPGILNLMFH